MKKILTALCLLFTVYALTSCTTTPVATPPKETPAPSTPAKPSTPATPTSPTKYKAAWDSKEPTWTPMLVAALQRSPLIKAKPAGVCGDPVQYWVDLFVAVALRESGYKASSQMTEAFRDSKGSPQISAGIFQLSLDDGKNYKKECSQFVKFADVLDPKKNIECAVVIMNRLVVERDGVIAEGTGTASRGGARYWSVLRTPDTRPHYRAEILAKAKASCK